MLIFLSSSGVKRNKRAAMLLFSAFIMVMLLHAITVIKHQIVYTSVQMLYLNKTSAQKSDLCMIKAKNPLWSLNFRIMTQKKQNILNRVYFIS